MCLSYATLLIQYRFNLGDAESETVFLAAKSEPGDIDELSRFLGPVFPLSGRFGMEST